MPASRDAEDSAIQKALDTTRNLDDSFVARGLHSWLDAHGGGTVVGLSAPLASGSSSELFMCELRDAVVAGPGVRRVVLRLIGQQSAYPDVDPALQYDCQRTINKYGNVPVPRVLSFESSAAWLGAPFIIMEEATGRGAPDFPSYVEQGWIADLSPADRSTLWQNGLEAIAALHMSELGNARDDKSIRLPYSGSALDRMVAYWQHYLAVVSEAGSYPVLDHAVAWLSDNRPDIPDCNVMIWGDASLRNMLFDKLAVSAMLDFEFSHVGLPQFEIAFFVMMDHLMAEAYAKRDRLTGFWNVERTFAHYEKLTGIPIHAPEYFCRMAVTYSALANTRVYQHLAREGRLEEEAVGTNPPLLYLAEMFRSTGQMG